MATIVCGASALEFWRVPPFVRALLRASKAHEVAPKLDQKRLSQACEEYIRTVDLWLLCANSVGHPLTAEGSFEVTWSPDLNGSDLSTPVELLVFSRKERRPSRAVRPRLWTGDLPPRSLVRIGADMAVTSPVFTLLLLARQLTLPKLVMVASELAGSFSAYETPAPIARLIEEMRAEGSLPDLEPWEPSFDRDGHLLDLWSRPPLLRVKDIGDFAAACKGARGARKLAEAARLVVPGAASPFEVKTGILLGWDTALGGEGLGGFSHNARIELGREARALAHSSCCYADLFWPGAKGRRALDLECKSARYHANEKSYLSDADRAAALQLEDIDVLELTYTRLASESRFDVFAALVARKLGANLPERSDEFLARRRTLRSEVLSA